MIQLKKGLDAEFEHVFSADPGLDKEHPDYNPEKFVETGDWKHLPVKAGEKVTVWVLRALPRRVLKEVDKLMLSEETLDAFSLALQYGLVRIKDGPEDFHLEHEETAKNGKRVKEDSLLKLYDMNLYSELGSRVYKASRAIPS